ncbi:1972_t:CDS:2, partial [Ambispora leptoticha]
KYCTGSAVYRTATNEFAEYKFKAFYMGESSLIEELTEKTITMIIGCFAFEDELNVNIKPNLFILEVTISQSVSLQIKTLQNEPTIYDLPIAPAFGIFSAPVQDPSEPHGDSAIFRLKKGVYNSMNGKTTDLSVICKYNPNPKGHHSNVAEATHRRTIFSVAGELIFVEKSVFVLCEAIEWNYYVMRENSKSQSCDETEHVKKKRKRDEELAKIAKVFESKNQHQQNKNRNHVIVD